ncbi:hypothetical protein MN116_005605 [Schistosoma mekongi]|uniref:PDZ domain-containing protein n=1 Tax=Schistosoma mekongi TaxID=38744 RepID=A0AAE1ZA09_SCHME|nr:hypothetical protein MN116_005605 [Schistosoma mekongi]
MLHVYDTKNDKNSGYINSSRKSRLNCNGIFVTDEDLNDSFQASSLVGSKTIYLKPLHKENDMLNSSFLNDNKKFPKAEHSALLPFTCNDKDTANCSTHSPLSLSTKAVRNNNNLALTSFSQSSSTLHRNSCYSPNTKSYNNNEHTTNNATHSIINSLSEEGGKNRQFQYQKSHDHRQHHHMNRSSFHRHSALRQSLGGMSIVSQHQHPLNTIHRHLSEPENYVPLSSYDSHNHSNKDVVKGIDTKLIYCPSSPSPTSSSIHTIITTTSDNNDSKSVRNAIHVDYQLKSLHLTNLPPWDHLNYTLKPFTSSHHGVKTKFKGFRLVGKIVPSTDCLPRVHTSYNIPFHVGDILISVNHQKLSEMSETQALQYVYSAFREAQQYSIDVDVLRPSLSTDNQSSRKSYLDDLSSSSTLSKQLIQRQKSDSGYCNSVEVSIPSSVHRPRRRRCTTNSSGEITPGQFPHNNKDESERSDDALLMGNANRSNLTRLNLMDYPDSQLLRLNSSQVSTTDDNLNEVIVCGDKINTTTIASSLCSSSNLADSGFITIRRPKQPARLTILDRNVDRFSVTGAESRSSPKVDITNSCQSSNYFDSRLLTPHNEEVTSPCIPRRSLNLSNKDPNVFNTRTIGQTMHIQLTKMITTGLGFTLTSRDTQTHTSQLSDPVYVKKILPDGAAMQDGRLMVGDRLLAINDQDVRSLNHALSQLRSLTAGKQVDLLISRQIPNDVDSPLINKNKKQLPLRPFVTHTFEYQLPPLDNQSDTTSIREPPVLGINFKWSDDVLSLTSSSSTVTTESMSTLVSSHYSPVPGLYIASLLPDSLVSSGNRVTVQSGDRLVSINGECVDGMNAKNIVSKLKNVIKRCHEERIKNFGKSTTTSFNLTVHRYKSNRRSSVGDTLKASSTLSPRQNKPIHDEAVDDISPSQHHHSKLNSNFSTDHTSSQDPCSLSFTLSDNRRRLLHRSDSISSEIGSYQLRHHNDTYSHRSPSQRLDVNDVDNHHLSSTESSLVVNNPSPRNLSVPCNRNFLRDGFGRRSVSEKRHGHVDASQYSIFQTNILPNRYKMPEDVDKQYSTMPTTRRLKMHKARLAAAATITDPHSSTTGQSIGISGPLKALHPVDTVLSQSLSKSSYRDPEEVDVELQLDQPPILRNRKQNTSFRHAVDRSYFPSTTDSLNIIPSSSSSPPPPPIPPHRPRSESNSRNKSNNSRHNKHSSKTKYSNVLLQESSNSVLSSSSPSVNRTPNRPERPCSKTHVEVHSNDSLLVEDTSSSRSISNNNNNNLQASTDQNKQNKSSLTSLKNLFRIGTSKTLSESNENSLIKNVGQSSKPSESITLLSKKQLRRLSVPDHHISSHVLTSPRLMNEDHKRDIYNNMTVPSVNQTPNYHPINGQSKLSSATHIYPQSICNDALYHTKSSNTIIVNPYCPPPDVNPPPLPPRVSYSTPPVLTPKSCHSNTMKYHPLPEPSDNVDKTKHTNRRKKSSHSSSISANHKPSSPAYYRSPKVISTTSSSVCSPSPHPSPLQLYSAEPTMVLSNVKKSNSCYNNRNESLNHNASLVPRDSPNCHHHHQQQRQHKSSNQNATTPAVYMNSQNISRESKKSTPSPHRSRSSHRRLSSNKSQHTNYHIHSNNSTITNNTAPTTMVVTTTPESFLYYQAPLLSSHSTMSTPRRHRNQDGRKSEYHLNNRILQVTMQEASLIASQPIDKLISSKRTSHNHHQ